MASDPIHSNAIGRSGPKRKTGCWTCRRRKVRCDEGKPVCSNCIRLRLDCQYGGRKPVSNQSTMVAEEPMPTPPPLSVDVNQNTTSNTTVPTFTSVPGSAITYPAQDWQFNGEFNSAFTSPFQDIFLSSIDNFDAGGDTFNGQWANDYVYTSSEISSDVDRAPQAPGDNTGPGTVPIVENNERQKLLIDHFVKSANPISVILPTATEWHSACRSLMNMAKQCQFVLSAICALSALHLSTTSSSETMRESFQHYQMSSQAVDTLLDQTNIDSRKLKQAFATLFLLTRVELMAQTNSQAKAYDWPLHHLQEAHNRVHQFSEQIDSWTGISKRLLTWTTLLQTKAEYNAGITTLKNSSAPLLNSTGDPFARRHTNPENSRGPFATQRNGHDSESRVDGSQTEVEDDTRTIPELAYDTVNQPAFDFFLKSQAFTSRIISLDRYHRHRGTVDAEFEILRQGQQISADLYALWESRPATVSFLEDPTALEEALQPRLARKVLLNIRVYVSNYYAQFIYLHRVAYNHYPPTEDVVKAIAKIMEMARCIDEDLTRRREAIPALQRIKTDPTSHSPNANSTVVRTPNDEGADSMDINTGLPASMLWPIFLAAIEGSSVEDRTWLLALVRNMDLQQVPDASKTAQLLEEVLRRQDAAGQRVDHRSVRKDLFDCELSVLY